MQPYRIEATILRDGKLTLRGLPFPAGDTVEIIVRPRPRERASNVRYPLRGKTVRYIEPLQSVAENEWEALR